MRTRAFSGLLVLCLTAGCANLEQVASADLARLEADIGSVGSAAKIVSTDAAVLEKLVLSVDAGSLPPQLQPLWLDIQSRAPKVNAVVQKTAQALDNGVAAIHAMSTVQQKAGK